MQTLVVKALKVVKAKKAAEAEETEQSKLVKYNTFMVISISSTKNDGAVAPTANRLFKKFMFIDFYDPSTIMRTPKGNIIFFTGDCNGPVLTKGIYVCDNKPLALLRIGLDCPDFALADDRNHLDTEHGSTVYEALEDIIAASTDRSEERRVGKEC